MERRRTMNRSSLRPFSMACSFQSTIIPFIIIVEWYILPRFIVTPHPNIFISLIMERAIERHLYALIIVDWRMKRQRPRSSSPEEPQQGPRPSSSPQSLHAALSKEDDDQLVVTHIPMHFNSQSHMGLLLRYLAVLRQQLPNMPLPHLHSLLFSQRHESLILTQADTLCGGLTFRQPYKKAYLQLQLLASSELGKGYGSHLVNHLKTIAQMRKIRAIVTHADNSAISFYQKIGFSTREYVPKAELEKELFTDATIMQAAIDDDLDYFALKYFHRKQREIITQKYRKSGYQVYKIGSLGEPIHIGSDYFRIDPHSIVGVGFDKEYKRLILTKEQQMYRKYVVHIDRLIAMAHPELVKMREELRQLPFLEYSDPIELQVLREYALGGQYEMKEEFMHDLRQFVRHCSAFYNQHPPVLASLDKIKQEIELISPEL